MLTVRATHVHVHVHVHAHAHAHAHVHVHVCMHTSQADCVSTITSSISSRHSHPLSSSAWATRSHSHRRWGLCSLHQAWRFRRTNAPSL